MFQLLLIFIVSAPIYTTLNNPKVEQAKLVPFEDIFKKVYGANYADGEEKFYLEMLLKTVLQNQEQKKIERQKQLDAQRIQQSQRDSVFKTILARHGPASSFLRDFHTTRY